MDLPAGLGSQHPSRAIYLLPEVAVYKMAVRSMIRRNINALNQGRYQPALAMFAADGELAFPGDNSWARQFRAPQPGRHVCASHRGRDEIETFLRSYTDHHIQMVIEDILVNGPPWNTRVAVRAHVWATGPDGDEEVYTNRAVIMARTSWGRIRQQEDYEDTERAAAYSALYPA
jgi:ketosteroid isomerase-like protein